MTQNPAAPAGVQLGAGVVKRPTRMPDGRELIYFDDADTALGPERRADARALDPRPATATMRRDVLTGDWGLGRRGPPAPRPPPAGRPRPPRAADPDEPVGDPRRL